MPKQGNSVESCLIVSWKKQKGEVVRGGEVLCEVETDKAVIEVESTASGVLLETFYAEGADVPVQTVIAVVGNPGESVVEFIPNEISRGAGEQSVATSQAITSAPVIEQALSVGPVSFQEFVGISPRAKTLATEKGLAIAELQGTGPSGRILERDIIAALSLRPLAPDPYNLKLETDLNSNSVAIPLQGVRKRIAERMLQSLQTTAQLTLNAYADARELQETRAVIKKNAEKFALPNITINDLIHFAVSRTLVDFPELNATFEHDTIYQHKHVHLGFAVDTPRGLMVPVIRHAQSQKLPLLSIKAKELATQAQEARIKPDDLQGGTFTVSNLGNFGIESFTPVLNPPQVAILGVGAITLKAVQIENSIEHIPHLSLSLTINHQIIDGAPAAKFLQALSSNIANIGGLLIA
jgi:pyruvate dehydrogenase E2 component (dihydrolipoamide acetyltransferase)